MIASTNCYGVFEFYMIETSCVQCGKIFKSFPSASRKLCSKQCTLLYQVGENSSRWLGAFREYFCGSCGKNFTKKIDGHKYKFCSSSCFSKNRIGSQGSNWQGGVRKCGKYIQIYAPSHPNNNHGTILLHRLKAEQYLGRLLSKKEVIHHIDGDKRNNKISNLYLFSTTNEHTAYHAKKNTITLKSNLLPLQQ